MKQASCILAVTLIVLSGAAIAQTMGNSRMVAQVPFEFVLANKIVPAGQWSVQSGTMDGHTLVIRNSDAKIGLFSTISFDESKTAASSYALVFKRYGDQYFLSGIKLQGSKVAYRLPESKAEAELRAQNVPVTQEILLAAAK